MAELKTNLDKTMFQEACATARDVKLAVTGSKYYLLCDFLDIQPISTDTTDIDEILILRKAKRLNSNIRSKYSDYENRKKFREEYVSFLTNNPYSKDVFIRFVDNVGKIIGGNTLIEKNVLEKGYF